MHNLNHFQYLLVHNIERLKVVLASVLVWFRGPDDTRIYLCLVKLARVGFEMLMPKTDIHERTAF